MKRLSGLLLAAAIVCTGCGTETTGPDAAGAQDVFTGRYVEAEITPPQAEGDISGLWLTDAGLVCGYYDAYYLTTDGGTTWTEMDTSWTRELEYDSYSIQYVEENGTVWFLTYLYVQAGADGPPYYQGTLWRIPPHGEPTKTPLGEDIHSFVKVLPLEAGKVLVQYDTLGPGGYEFGQSVGVFDVDSGDLLYKVEYSPFDNTGVVQISDGFIYFFQIAGSDTVGFTAKQFDPIHGTELNSYPNILPRDGFHFRNQTSGPIAVAHDNLYYVHQQQGICRVAMAGSLSEVILEYDRYACQGNGMDVWDFLIDDQDSLYVVSRSIEYNPSVRDRLYRYVYDPDAPYDQGSRPQSTTYYAQRNPGENNSSIYAALPDGKHVVVAEDIHQIQAENENYILFTRARIDGEVQTQPAVLTLHYYDKSADEVRDIFTDTWQTWGAEYSTTAGVVLGAISGDKEWNLTHPEYRLEDDKLLFYLSNIEENKTEQYLFVFATGHLELQDTIDWNG